MKKSLILAGILAFVISGSAYAEGFIIGAGVMATDRAGNVSEGTLISFVGDRGLRLTDSSGHQFILLLNKIKSVSGVYGDDFTTVSGLRMTPVKVETTDGQSMTVGFTDNTMFTIDMGVKGTKAVYFPSPDRWASIEALEPKPQPKSDMVIKLKDGRTIDVPVKKEDISSIEFN